MFSVKLPLSPPRQFTISNFTFYELDSPLPLMYTSPACREELGHHYPTTNTSMQNLVGLGGVLGLGLSLKTRCEYTQGHIAWTE